MELLEQMVLQEQTEQAEHQEQMANHLVISITELMLYHYLEIQELATLHGIIQLKEIQLK